MGNNDVLIQLYNRFEQEKQAAVKAATPDQPNDAIERLQIRAETLSEVLETIVDVHKTLPQQSPELKRIYENCHKLALACREFALLLAENGTALDQPTLITFVNARMEMTAQILNAFTLEAPNDYAATDQTLDEMTTVRAQLRRNVGVNRGGNSPIQ